MKSEWKGESFLQVGINISLTLTIGLMTLKSHKGWTIVLQKTKTFNSNLLDLESKILLYQKYIELY